MSDRRPERIDKHHSQYAALCFIAAVSTIDNMVLIATLGRYETTLRQDVLFYADDDTVKSMIKAIFRGSNIER
jgi:hypothetical protein